MCRPCSAVTHYERSYAEWNVIYVFSYSYANALWFSHYERSEAAVNVQRETLKKLAGNETLKKLAGNETLKKLAGNETLKKLAGIYCRKLQSS